MADKDSLAEQFEEKRGLLRGVAYRMLGSLAEADDAVQEAWISASRVRSQTLRRRPALQCAWPMTSGLPIESGARW